MASPAATAAGRSSFSWIKSGGQPFEVVRVSAGGFEVGHGDCEAVQHEGGKIWLHLRAGTVAECGGDALKAQIGGRISRARPGRVDARPYPATILVPPTASFDRLLPALGAICRCPSRSRGRSWSQNCRESGECRFKRIEEICAKYPINQS